MEIQSSDCHHFQVSDYLFFSFSSVNDKEMDVLHKNSLSMLGLL